MIDNYSKFIQEITPTLISIENDNSKWIIASDFNMDLKLNEEEVCCECFDNFDRKIVFIQRLHFQLNFRKSMAP